MTRNYFSHFVSSGVSADGLAFSPFPFAAILPSRIAGVSIFRVTKDAMLRAMAAPMLLSTVAAFGEIRGQAGCLR